MKRLARLAATGSLLAILASAQPMIHLRNRTIAAARGASRQRLVPGRHQMVQFASYPSADLLEQLSRRGVRVLEYIPDNALMVSGASAAALEGLDVTFAGSLEPADKIAPELARKSTNSYLAIFHADVTAARARELVQGTGFDILEHPDLVSNHLVITGSFDRLAELAARDELAYVMAASVDLVARARVLRCPGPTAAAGSVGEYAQVGAGWPKDAAGAVALKYVLQNLTSKADSNSVRGEIERAFREWTKYANISISEGAAGDAARTIAIKFAAGVHGDGYPFDGPGKVLAHTFYPAPLNPEPLAGDMHMDGDEDWRIGAGVDVFSVALHEAGHALGLAHSTQPGAVMYPYYRLSTGLAADDISGIQSVYGNPAVNSPAPPVTPTPAKPVVPVVPIPAVPVPPVTPPLAPRAPPATPSKDVTAPSLRIVTPGVTILSTTASTITITGTASDNLAVASVKWFTGTGASGIAAGTVSWSTTIPLLSGTNVITVRAYDAAGNSGWRSLTVVKP